jgi:hypothetical protein
MAVVPHFAVMLRQILFLPPVEYEKSTLQSAKTYLPCLTTKAGTARCAQIERQGKRKRPGLQSGPSTHIVKDSG